MSTRSRALTAVTTAVVLACPAVALSASSAAPSQTPAAAAAEVPPGFQDTVAIDGLSEPTAVAFAPDGTAFIGLKTGVIKSFDYDPASGTYEPWASHVNVTNLDVQVNNYWDRGLTGIAVDPQFGTAGNNYVYVNYAYNRDPRVTPESYPAWGTPGQQYDECPDPASMGPPAVNGCIINIRVSRIPVAKQASGWIASGPEEELLEGACMQFPSHASGDVAFGPDGYLYASAGDGASFDTEDYGQAGNPCGDPANEGGSLRSQDIRTSGDPLSVSGSIFRIDRATGAAPNGSTSNADRIVAYGQRNPWRLTFRPGTSELWSGDVGGSIWEEINRVDMASFTAPVNRGWPCYEGSYTGVQRQPGWDALNRDICETLYGAEAATPGTVTPPYFSYRTRNGGPMTPGENCVEGTSSVSGVAFIPPTSTYPAQYRGSLFFNDYARGCIWRLGKLGNGDPDPSSITPFVEAADTPVAIEVGPGGDLFYVDYGIVNGVPTGGAGGIHRIVYTPGNQAPVAAVTANPTSGAAPLTVDFSAAGSTDGDGDPLTFEWALDGDGVFDDGGGATKSRTYATPGSVTVRVRVSDGRGGTDTEEVVVSPGNSPPTITAMSPAASLTWSVGETISFSASATDSQQSLSDSAYAWSLSIQHCPSVCHTHPIQTWVGQRTGSFQAPDHEYPSNLLLQVTVTDNQGLTDVETRQLDPKSVSMTFASNPTGAALTVAGAGVFAPHSQTFIQGSNLNVSAPLTRQVGGANYTFTSWSDGGAANHSVVAPTTATTLTASYTRQNRLPTVTVSANPTSGTAPLTIDFSTEVTDPDGDNAGFTYEWALDGDGVFNDGGGATKQRQYPTAGSRAVQVRVTDSHGGQDTDQVTVNVAANQPPVAVISPANPSGPAPLLVNFDANGSSDPNGHALTFAWDLDDDGAFDDATGATASRTYPVGDHVVRLLATDSIGATNLAQVTVASGNTAPVLGPVTPADGAPWSVGETVAFSASATDGQDGELPASAFTWTLEKVECATGCSPVVVETFDDVTTGSFVAPDLDLPSHLRLTVTVVDSRGTPATRTVRLDPRTVDLSFATSPAGMDVDLARMTATPTTRTVIVGSTIAVSAPERQRQGPRLFEFGSWSDGGPRTHVVTAPSGARLYVASYEPVRRRVTFLTRPGGLDVKVDGRVRVDRWARRFDVGESVKVAAPKRQWRDGVLYEFVRWSDDGARVHTIVVPDVRMRLRAVYRRAQA